ncbi:Ig-like domain-containing protein, partial [Roseivirga echinicomitans]|uniref:Ig-like domain-containing protein n=1 Tax=Roseivirga echinicomitans TaxID=296218 RepID=UPI000A9261D1
MRVYSKSLRSFVRMQAFVLLLILNPVSGHTETRFSKVDVLNRAAKIKKIGRSTVDVSSYWLNHSFTYHKVNTGTFLSGSTTIQVDEELELGMSATLNASASDLTLHSTPGFGSLSAIVDFTVKGRENVAVSKGIWAIETKLDEHNSIPYTDDGAEHFATIGNVISAPTITSITRKTPTGAITNADQVVFRVTFVGNVKNVDVTDFTLSGTAAGDGTVASVAAVSGAIYDVTVTGLTNSNGTVNLDIKGNGGVSGTNDIESNPEVIDQNVSSGATNTIDRTEWGQSFQANTSGNLTKADLFIEYGYNGNMTMELRQGEGLGGALLATEVVDVSGLTGDQSFTFSTPAAVTSGSQYTLRFTTASPAHDQELVLSIKSGNPLANGVLYQPGELSSFDLLFRATIDNGEPSGSLSTTAPSTDETFTLENVKPTVTITIADAALKAGETTLVTFTFSEVVTGFANADITIPNGTMTAVSSADGGTTYT